MPGRHRVNTTLVTLPVSVTDRDGDTFKPAEGRFSTLEMGSNRMSRFSLQSTNRSQSY